MDPIARIYKQRDEEGRDKIRNYRKPPQRFRASELTDCKRQIWYRLSGYVPAPRTGFDDDWSRDGDVHHDLVRALMREYGVRIAGVTFNEDGTQTEDRFIVHDFDVDGRQISVSTRQDGWIYHEDYGWILLEIKSVGHWVHKYQLDAYAGIGQREDGTDRTGGHDDLLDYIKVKKPEWIAQCHAGMKIAQERGVDALPFPSDEKHDLTKAYLVVKDRSNCHIGYHDDDIGVVGGVVIDFEQETWDKITRRLYATKGKVLDGKPPLPEYTSSSRACGYCPFRYLCHDARKRQKNGHTPAILYPDPECGVHYDDPED